MKRLRVTLHGKSYDVTVECLEEGEGQEVKSTESLETASSVSGPSASDEGISLHSPLAGKVVSLTVQAGQDVKEGDEIMVLEAMKMNTQVHAPSSGRILALRVQPGDQVEEGQTLVTMGS
jgi:biotin carboxyl carrier protein